MLRMTSCDLFRAYSRVSSPEVTRLVLESLVGPSGLETSTLVPARYGVVVPASLGLTIP